MRYFSVSLNLYPRILAGVPRNCFHTCTDHRRARTVPKTTQAAKKPYYDLFRRQRGITGNYGGGHERLHRGPALTITRYEQERGDPERQLALAEYHEVNPDLLKVRVF